MPTKKKRVGFIPREDVMRIIDKLSIENNLSNSKIISILNQQVVFNRRKKPSYAAKMKTTMNIVRKRLKKK